MPASRPRTVSLELMHLLEGVNARRRSSLPPPPPDVEEAALEDRVRASHRLAVYGSLKPGEIHHDLVSHLSGTWQDGDVFGDWSDTGWGAGVGFPAIRWRPDGDRVPVKLLASADLPAEWARLDAFEGEEYRRILVPVFDRDTFLAVANLYEARSAGG